jgi:hypothetical protein
MLPRSNLVSSQSEVCDQLESSSPALLYVENVFGFQFFVLTAP